MSTANNNQSSEAGMSLDLERLSAECLELQDWLWEPSVQRTAVSVQRTAVSVQRTTEANMSTGRTGIKFHYMEKVAISPTEFAGPNFSTIWDGGHGQQEVKLDVPLGTVVFKCTNQALTEALAMLLNAACTEVRLDIRLPLKSEK